jgi:FliI/YscN family ATPase
LTLAEGAFAVRPEFGNRPETESGRLISRAFGQGQAGESAEEAENRRIAEAAEAARRAEAQSRKAAEAEELLRQEAWRQGKAVGEAEATQRLEALAAVLRRAEAEWNALKDSLVRSMREEFARRLEASAKALCSGAHPEAVAAAALRIAEEALARGEEGPLVLSCEPTLAPQVSEALGTDGRIRVEADPALAPGEAALRTAGEFLKALPTDFQRVALAAARGEETESPWRAVGMVVRTRGPLLEAEGVRMNLGELAEIGAPEQGLWAEAVGFDAGKALLSPLGDVRGLRAGERVAALGRSVEVPFGRPLLGHVLDALGRPLEGKTLPEGLKRIGVHPWQGMRDPLEMARVKERFETGVAAVDGFLTCGIGQRLGIFAGSGVGKSTLLGMMARRARADAVVIGLIGERGREVRDFLEQVLGDEGRARSVVVVATSDQPPALRVQAALTATALAESFRAEGGKVLLLMDSVTRFAQSLREIGLSLGEPPATRGYPPSVFAALPRLMERAGALEAGGAITAFYTVLVEGDDMNEPIADAVRGILDGHLVLSRAVAEGGRYPAVDLLASLSRCMPEVAEPRHLALAQRGRRLFSAVESVRDLISVGAYKEGSDPLVDEARRVCPRIEDLLRQGPGEDRPMDNTVQSLNALLSGGNA